MKENLPSQPSRIPFLVGTTGTILWLILAIEYMWPVGSALLELKPNEFGDFLAGIFAPLAFLWIVVGYLQQSTELRLQVQELSHQVSATREMADAALAQGRRESLQAQPVLVRSGGSGKGGVLHSFDLVNLGAPVTNVSLLSCPGRLNVTIPKKAHLGKGERLRVHIETPSSGWFQIGYVDFYQQEGTVWGYFDGADKVLVRRVGRPPVPESDLAAWVESKAP